MFDEKKYIEKLFQKKRNFQYEDDFFNSNYLANSNKLQIIYSIMIIGIFMISITVTAFFGNEIYKKRFEKINSVEKNEEFCNLDMIFDNKNNLEYKIVDNKEDYLKIKEFYDVPIISFDNEYLSIIETNFGIINEMNILDIEADETTTYITLGNTEITYGDEKKDNILFFKINNEYKRENVEFSLIPGSDIVEKYGLISMKKIDKNYIEINSYNDENCLITDNVGRLKSNNLEILYNFLENKQNMAIRIIRPTLNDYNETIYKVTDLVFENGKYYYFHAIFDESCRASFPISQSVDGFGLSDGYVLYKISDNIKQGITLFHFN